mmetsp:Transcript_39114/g.90118  ORF Transcript_39114/g.90118 Transcript_39114/m.90118 type:complete len:221 (+) Transcript_39114:525-1187(+)
MRRVAVTYADLGDDALRVPRVERGDLTKQVLPRAVLADPLDRVVPLLPHHAHAGAVPHVVRRVLRRQVKAWSERQCAHRLHVRATQVGNRPLQRRYAFDCCSRLRRTGRRVHLALVVGHERLEFISVTCRVTSEQVDLGEHLGLEVRHLRLNLGGGHILMPPRTRLPYLLLRRGGRGRGRRVDRVLESAHQGRLPVHATVSQGEPCRCVVGGLALMQREG